MRILFWSQYFWPDIGGSETFALNLLSVLQERGYEFIVVAAHLDSGASDKAEYNGIPIYRFSLREALATGDLQQILMLSQELNCLNLTFRPDVVHVNSIGPIDFFLRRAMDAHPSPYLLTMQQHIPPEFLTPYALPGATMRAANWVACCSAAMLVEAREQVPEIAHRSSVIYNGVESPTLLPAPLPFDPPRLLCLGRLLSFKGFDLAIRCFADIVVDFPGARLMIAGDGPARSELNALAGRLDITTAVDFLGWISPDEVPAVINAATVVVMPSRWEGFAFVAIEAAVMTRPIVATRAGGLQEAVLDGHTGLIVEKEDSVALTEAIRNLLCNPEMATRMGLAARQRALRLFSLERCVNAYEALYRKISTEPANLNRT